MHHELKIESQYAIQILDGKKTFEIRKNDRGFNAGDTVLLEVIDLDFGVYKYIHADIGYVTNFNQKEDYVVFSLLNVRAK